MDATITHTVLALICLIGAVACKAVTETLTTQRHQRSIWRKKPIYSFWGEYSWTRKYYRNPVHGTFELAPDNWYYRFFHLKYREWFPGSTTFLDFVTDASSFFKWLTITLCVLAVSLLVWTDYTALLVGFISIRLLCTVVYMLMFDRVLYEY